MLRLGNHGEDFVFAHDQVFVAVDFDVAARIFTEKDFVADLEFEDHNVSLIVTLSFADGDDFAFLRLFFRRVRDDDAALNLFLFLEPLDNDAVVEGTNIHNVDLWTLDPVFAAWRHSEGAPATGNTDVCL